MKRIGLASDIFEKQVCLQGPPKSNMGADPYFRLQSLSSLA